jgi:hypothetical protein
VDFIRKSSTRWSNRLDSGANFGLFKHQKVKVYPQKIECSVKVNQNKLRI